MNFLSKIRVSMAILAASCALVGTASASVMTFEGLTPPGKFRFPIPQYFESGFSLTFQSPSKTSDGLFSASSGVNTNGTDIFGWCAGCDPETVITLSKVDGGDFSFLSFDTANLKRYKASNTIDVIGHLSGGSTSTTSLTLTDTWTHYDFSGFSDVSSVDFAYGAGHNRLLNHAFDNLTMGAANSVPEPSSLALIGLALAVLATRVKRKQD